MKTSINTQGGSEDHLFFGRKSSKSNDRYCRKIYSASTLVVFFFQIEMMKLAFFMKLIAGDMIIAEIKCRAKTT